MVWWIRTNVYAYVGGNPISEIDPLGLWGIGDPLPQSVVDTLAGFGDTAGFGVARHIRRLWNIDSVVCETSNAYVGGSIAGIRAAFGSAFALGTAINIGIRALGGAATVYHFTSIAAAAEAAESGAIAAGPGIYGEGVYVTAINSLVWATISGAASTEVAIVLEDAEVLATAFPGTFRIAGSVAW